MPDDMIMIQHRKTDQLLSVPLSRYRMLYRRRYRNWKLHGQSQFIAPPQLSSVAHANGYDSLTSLSLPYNKRGASKRE